MWELEIPSWILSFMKERMGSPEAELRTDGEAALVGAGTGQVGLASQPSP